MRVSPHKKVSEEDAAGQDLKAKNLTGHHPDLGGCSFLCCERCSSCPSSILYGILVGRTCINTEALCTWNRNTAGAHATSPALLPQLWVLFPTALPSVSHYRLMYCVFIHSPVYLFFRKNVEYMARTLPVSFSDNLRVLGYTCSTK